MLQPWFTGEEKEPALCSLRLDFHFYVEDRPEELRLAMETPEEFDLLVNGTPDAAAVSGDFWVDPCFRILKISPQVLRPGKIPSPFYAGSTALSIWRRFICWGISA